MPKEGHLLQAQDLNVIKEMINKFEYTKRTKITPDAVQKG